MINNRKTRRRQAAIVRKQNRVCVTKHHGPAARAMVGVVGLGAAIAFPGAGHSQSIPPSVVSDTCTISGTSATCSGDLSSGITTTGPGVDAVTVQSLTGDIAPDAGVAGISFINEESDDAGIEINVTGDGHQISTNGASGIDAVSAAAGGGDAYFAGGDITITSDADITTSGASAHGISAATGFSRAFDASDIRITSTGDIAASGEGSIGINITNSTYGGMGVVQSTGDIESGLSGINVRTIYGAVSITSVGNITSTDGISARGVGSGIDIASTGDIAALGHGIRTLGHDLDINIQSTGNIAAGSGDAINIQANSDAIDVTSVGNLSSAAGNGIGIDLRYRSDADITISTTGDVTAEHTAIAIGHSGYASSGDVNITSVGNIASHSGSGIVTNLEDGNRTIHSTGDITVHSTGIFANSYMGQISVQSEGNIHAGFNGISAFGGAVDVIADGNIMTERGDGIRSYSLFSTNIQSTGNITALTGTGIEARAGILAGNLHVETSGTITAQTGIEMRDNYDGLDRLDGLNLINSGHITADQSGVFFNTSQDRALSITNSGSITGETGIFSTGSVEIANSGHIQGDGGFAINLTGDSADVLTLDAGSTIVGAIDFGNGNDGLGGANANDIDVLNLNVSAGTSTILQFADASGLDSDFESMPEIINYSGPNQLVTLDSNLVVYDMTSFAAPSAFMSGLSGGVLNALDSQNNAANLGATSDIVSRGVGVWPSEPPQFWGAAFGGRSSTGSNDTAGELEHSYSGFTVGMESDVSNSEGVWGILAGATNSSIDLSLGAGNTDIASAFAGVYWRRDFDDVQLRASLLGGVTENDTTRVINALPATGSFEGTFIAPSVAVAVPFEIADVSMTFDTRATYMQMQLDGYTEDGAVETFIHCRDVSVFNLRSQIQTQSLFDEMGWAQSQLKLRLGVDATVDAGSDPVMATLLGSTVEFDSQNLDEINGFVGFDFLHQSVDDHWDIALNGEVQTDFESGYGVNLGVRVNFSF